MFTPTVALATPLASTRVSAVVLVPLGASFAALISTLKLALVVKEPSETSMLNVSEVLLIWLLIAALLGSYV